MIYMSVKRDFKGVWIPKEIWLSKELTLQEKVFLVEIDSLDNDEGCFASNAHFSEFFGLSSSRCSQIINSLEEKGFITIEYVYGEKKEIKKRVIKVLNKLNTPIKFSKGGYLENAKGINTFINNTKEYIYTIFEYWNEKSIIKHRKMNQAMESHINARLKEYSVDELKKAIDNYKEVLDNPNYYWTHKWTLQDFMKPNNVVRFLDDSNPFQSFLKNKNDNFIRSEKQQPQGRYIPSDFDYEAAKTAGEDPDWWRQ